MDADIRAVAPGIGTAANLLFLLLPLPFILFQPCFYTASLFFGLSSLAFLLFRFIIFFYLNDPAKTEHVGSQAYCD